MLTLTRRVVRVQSVSQARLSHSEESERVGGDERHSKLDAIRGKIMIAWFTQRTIAQGDVKGRKHANVCCVDGLAVFVPRLDRAGNLMS